MNAWNVPWLELSIIVPLIGSVWVSRFRDPVRAFGWGLAFTGATLACALLAGLGYYAGPARSVQPVLFGRTLFALDLPHIVMPQNAAWNADTFAHDFGSHILGTAQMKASFTAPRFP